MMWSATHFPAAMRSLNPTTRAKAIEIANDLLSRGGLEKQQIISTSIDEARKWARRSYTDADRNGAYMPRRF
ncbi:hypothetical protein GCM10023189_48730 [Nibrella saemangeumensis]|uniref:DUF2188 domain-containing protein n=1 Tax=Nibrella saemangeumensis TaxID=1084526 RepID=A0ABP8NIS4_9BACT